MMGQTRALIIIICLLIISSCFYKNYKPNKEYIENEFLQNKVEPLFTEYYYEFKNICFLEDLPINYKQEMQVKKSLIEGQDYEHYIKLIVENLNGVKYDSLYFHCPFDLHYSGLSGIYSTYIWVYYKGKNIRSYRITKGYDEIRFDTLKKLSDISANWMKVKHGCENSLLLIFVLDKKSNLLRYRFVFNPEDVYNFYDTY